MRLARESWSISLGVKKGRPLPAWFMEEDLPDDIIADFYLREYRRLCTERPQGFGPTDIPHSRIVARADRLGLEPDMHETFVRIMEELNDWHVEKQREES